MARCKECGKKGLFLRVNARGLCEECTKKASLSPKSGQIVLSISGINKDDEYAKIGHSDEEKACQYVIDELVKRGKDRNSFSIEHRASDYTSLVYDKTNDFIRIKMTDNVYWISIALTEIDQKKYLDDPLFSAQANKRQRHWRSNFDSYSQLSRYIDIAENACVSISFCDEREITTKEKEVADYIANLFIKCGAEPNQIVYYTTSRDFNLLFLNWRGKISFKAYAKKPGGYIHADWDFETVNIKTEKSKFPFFQLSDLDCLSEKLLPLKMKNALELHAYYCEEQYPKYFN